jgi:hypothetical protein
MSQLKSEQDQWVALEAPLRSRPAQQDHGESHGLQAVEKVLVRKGP